MTTDNLCAFIRFIHVYAYVVYMCACIKGFNVKQTVNLPFSPFLSDSAFPLLYSHHYWLQKFFIIPHRNHAAFKTPHFPSPWSPVFYFLSVYIPCTSCK